MFLAINLIANLAFTPHTTCSPKNFNFFKAISYLALDRSNFSEGKLWAFIWPFPKPAVLY